MSGGQSRAASAKAGRWDKKEGDTLKKRLRTLMTRRAELESQGFITSTDSQNRSSSSRGRRRRGNTSSSSSSSRSVISKASRDGTLSRQLDSMRAQHTALESKIKNLESFIQKHRKKVQEATKRMANIDNSLEANAPVCTRKTLLVDVYVKQSV